MTDKMPYKENSVNLIQYDILKGVKHCFTTRTGGVSEGACASLNMSFSREASAENVRENYRRVADALNVDFGKMTRVPQLHTDHVLNITDDLVGIGITKPFPEGMDEYGYDAMITNVPGAVLCTVHADCVPVFLYYDGTRDENAGGRAIGVVHSGWRGTALKISANTVRMMKEELGADPSKIKAVIGPSISADRFETDSDVYEAMKAAFGDLTEDRRLVYKCGAKYKISVSGFVYHTLIEAGLRDENIYHDNSCTYVSSDIFFSHRRDKGRTGAMSAVISL